MTLILSRDIYESLSQERCPVCDTDLDGGSLHRIPLNALRGKQIWARCPECRSFFAIEQYDAEQEIVHTRTRPWGVLECASALNKDKAPMFEAILRALDTFASKGDMLLDIGCSCGGFLQYAQKAGYQVQGVDIVPESAEYVRSLGIACAHAGFVDDLNIAENSIGIVSVLDCNYYWPNQRKELRAIHSRLRPGGLLVMRVVDTSWAVQIGLWLRMRFPKTGRSLCEKAVYDHRVSIPVRSFLSLIDQEGFDVVYTSQFDAMPSCHKSFKISLVYVIGSIVWRVFGYNLAPGFVLVARKRTS